MFAAAVPAAADTWLLLVMTRNWFACAALWSLLQVWLCEGSCADDVLHGTPHADGRHHWPLFKSSVVCLLCCVFIAAGMAL
jgi:hypothetical protein